MSCRGGVDSVKPYGEKPLGLVSFAAKSRSSGLVPPSYHKGNRGIGSLARVGKIDRGARCCVPDRPLPRSDHAGSDSEEELLYYGTSRSFLAGKRHQVVAAPSRCAGYPTHAGVKNFPVSVEPPGDSFRPTLRGGQSPEATGSPCGPASSKADPPFPPGCWRLRDSRPCPRCGAGKTSNWTKRPPTRSRINPTIPKWRRRRRIPVKRCASA